MKIPIFNKYFSINLFIYILIIRALFCLLISQSFIFGILGFLWFYMLYLFLVLDFFIPINILLIILELILFKTNLLKQKCTITTNSKYQVLIYITTTIAFLYYLWYTLYFKQILNEKLLLD